MDKNKNARHRKEQKQQEEERLHKGILDVVRESTDMSAGETRWELWKESGKHEAAAQSLTGNSQLMGKDIQLPGNELLTKTATMERWAPSVTEKKTNSFAYQQNYKRDLEEKKQKEVKPEGKVAGSFWPHYRPYLKLIQFWPQLHGVKCSIHNEMNRFTWYKIFRVPSGENEVSS